MTAAEADEPVRLVIWDLDDTLWRGTLSEGGIDAYSQINHDIVVTLAKRGILNSICSKNDYSSVRDVLRNKGLWDYFVFPSIGWTPKGARIAAQIDTFQLRPESVLFIDDSAANRAEAERDAPFLRTLAATAIPELLANPLCRGGSDPDLTRLQQYKVLERRLEARAAIEGDNSAFLRDSDIHVSIEIDVDAHLDRAIELINRTNQLNLTKFRLPDDAAEARKELAAHVTRHDVQAGLVHVSDKYGDYGFCGFFSKYNDNNGSVGRLVHFCFSCRILGMGVEDWLYERLGSPPFRIDNKLVRGLAGERHVDWISLDDGPNRNATPRASAATPIEVRFRGGCELAALTHYFRFGANVTGLESNYLANAFTSVRKDFSSLLVNALHLTPAMLRDAAAAGLPEDDVSSTFLEGGDGSLLVLSTWADVDVPLYRHRTLGFRMPCSIEKLRRVDVTRLTPDEIDASFGPGTEPHVRERVRETIAAIRDKFEFEGLVEEGVLASDLEIIFRAVPDRLVLALILPSSTGVASGRTFSRPRADAYKKVARSVAKAFDNVLLLDIADALEDPSDQLEGTEHFKRLVYARLSELLMERVRPMLAASADGGKVGMRE